jgi:hypothetical protein
LSFSKILSSPWGRLTFLRDHREAIAAMAIAGIGDACGLRTRLGGN